MRNLILVLAKVGDESHVDHLLPLVSNKDRRVQREALYTISQLGGTPKGGDTLLGLLPHADDQMKMDIVELLGALKYKKAVPTLLQLLNGRSLGFGKPSLGLKQKVCHALGVIKSRDAVPTLARICGPKGFRFKSIHSSQLKDAAQQALHAIVNTSADR
jgi:HEAT repeat protein